MPTVPSKICTRCGDLRPLDEYHKNKAASDGHTYHCKTCVSADKKLARGVAQTIKRCGEQRAAVAGLNTRSRVTIGKLDLSS